MPADAPSRAAVLAVLVGATAVGPLAMNVFVPSMPGLQATLGANYAEVQLTLSLYLVAFAVAQLMYGPLSDRWGRRPVLLAGLTLFVAGSAACALAPTIGTLIAARCLQATGACAGMVLGRAIVQDLYDRERAAAMIAYMTMAMMVAPMLAPSIGGFLDVWFGWRAGFAFVAACGALALAGVFRVLGETHPPAGGRFRVHSLLMGFVHLSRRRAFLAYALQIGFTAASFFAFLGGAPYVLVKLLGRPASDYGLYFILIAGSYIVGNFLSARLNRRVGMDRLIRGGLGIALAGTVLLVAAALVGWIEPIVLFGCMGVVGFGHGFIIANGFAGAVSVDPERAGAASGLTGFLQMGAGAVASFMVGLMMDDSALPMALAVMLTAAAALVAFVTLLPGRRSAAVKSG